MMFIGSRLPLTHLIVLSINVRPENATHGFLVRSDRVKWHVPIGSTSHVLCFCLLIPDYVPIAVV